MERYEVTVRNKENDYRWTMMFSANNFAHAEEQVNDGNYLDAKDEIISITKDYAS